MVTRITGMASGMDIDAIVKKLMTAEKVPLDRMSQKKQLMEWKRESYRETSTKMVSFLQDKLQTLSLDSSIKAQKANVTGNTNAVSATAVAGGSGGSMDITVNKLATATRMTTGVGWTEKSGGDALSSLFDPDNSDPSKVPTSITIGAATITLDGTETIDSFIKKVNSNSASGVTAIYDAKAGLSFTSKTTGASDIKISTDVDSDGADFAAAFNLANRMTTGAGWAEKSGGAALSSLFTAGNAPTSVTIGAATITLDGTETIDGFVKAVNSNSASGVTAIYDSKAGLSIISKTTGAADITISASKGATAVDFVTAFKLEDFKGKDASVTINGLTMSKPTNNFTLNGVDISLKAEGGASTHIEVVKDTDALVKNVQSFVDAYNDVLNTLNSKVNEERYKKYAPLTTEQRSAMSDDEAELWTNKAKSGMLKNDSILQDAVAEMRNAMVQGVDIGRPDKTPLTMSELGITTGTYETKGKLLLDADQLKEALEKDPDIISKFFGSQDPATRLTNNYTEKDGVIAKLKKIGNVSLQRMAETAGTSKVSSSLTATFISNSSIGQELSSLDRRISDMTSRLNTIETNYYKKFTAMETAINRYNSSSSAIAGM